MAAALKCQAAQTTRRRLSGAMDLGGGPTPGDPGSKNLWSSRLSDTDRARSPCAMAETCKKGASENRRPGSHPQDAGSKHGPVLLANSSKCDSSAWLPP